MRSCLHIQKKTISAHNGMETPNLIPLCALFYNGRDHDIDLAVFMPEKPWRTVKLIDFLHLCRKLRNGEDVLGLVLQYLSNDDNGTTTKTAYQVRRTDAERVDAIAQILYKRGDA